MKKHILIFCSLAVSLFFTACGDTEEPTFEGTLVTGYLTIPEKTFYFYAGEKEEIATSLLYSFMTDESRKYWEAFEYSSIVTNYEEYVRQKEIQEKKCTNHYKEQKSRLIGEPLEDIFTSAPDSCVFTGQFYMTLRAFPEEYDTLFTVQRPVFNDTQWKKAEGSGDSEILSIRFTGDTYAELENPAGTEQIKYKRFGNTITLSTMSNSDLFLLRIPTIHKFILYDLSGKTKHGEYEQITAVLEE